MQRLNLDWNQKRPTAVEARVMCQQVSLEIRELSDPRLDAVLSRICETHQNGGALFASFQVGPSEAFDWFASRNRLLEFGILKLLLNRVEVTTALPSLQIQPAKPEDPAFAVHSLREVVSSEQITSIMNSEITGNELRRHGVTAEYEVWVPTEYDGFQETSSFLFDGALAQSLYSGGAYASSTGNGRSEKEKSLAFCDALFDLRFSEVWYCSSHSSWTPWFGNIAWDWTAILFDQRLRALSILAITDSD